MKKLLLIGFEAFNEVSINPSGITAEYFNNKKIKDYEIKGIILPVNYKESSEKLNKTLKEYNPDITLLTGVKAGIPYISIERVALNLIDEPTPDNKGEKRYEIPVINNAPLLHYSKLPINEIKKKLLENGIPAIISRDAGGYLCNYVFYHLMNNFNKISGLIHVPINHELAAKNQLFLGKPAMSQEKINQAIQIIIETI